MVCFIVPRLFEEKQGDIVFDIQSFLPPSSSRYLGLETPPTVLMPVYFETLHGLKMWILFGHNPQVIFEAERSDFYSQSESIQGVLCWQLLLQFYANSFETLQVLKMCIVLDITLKLFFVAYTPVLKRQSYYGMAVSVLPSTCP